MSAEHSDKLIGTVLDGKYKVIARIGEGGMGALYMAQHTQLGRTVAVKVLVEKLSGDEKYLRRFQQEAKLAAGLSHSNVAHVYDYGQLQSGAPYLVMDFLEGNTLAAVLQERGFLPVAEALPIIQQICKGLAHAHGRGLVHRDLKPSNIMIVSADGENVVKVLDFGIAKEVDSVQGLTQTGELFGSPLYMSPEQCSGHPVDARSDIYSVGCLMYEVLTGEVPLRGESIVQTIFKHMNESPLPIKQACPACDAGPAVEDVIRRAMAKNRDDRFQTVGELNEHFTRAVAAQPGDVTAVAVPAPDKKAAGKEAGAQAVAARGGTAQAVMGSGARAEAGGKQSGIVISPVVGLAILGAALIVGGAAVMIAGRRETPPPQAVSMATSSASTDAGLPAETADPADAPTAAEDRVEAEAERIDLVEAEADAAADGGPQQVTINGNKMSIKDGDQTVDIDGTSLKIKDGKQNISLDIPGLPNMFGGGVSAGADVRKLNQPLAGSASKWKRDDVTNPLLAWKNPNRTGLPKVHVVYAHQAWDQGHGHDNDYLHIGHLNVNVSDRDRAVILVLVGFAPIVWNVQAQPGVKMTKVIVGGLHQQQVTGLPRNTPVMESSERLPPGQDDPPDAYSVRSKPRFSFPTFNLVRGDDVASTSSFIQMADTIHRLTGRPITSFQYCRQEKEFSL